MAGRRDRHNTASTPAATAAGGAISAITNNAVVISMVSSQSGVVGGLRYRLAFSDLLRASQSAARNPIAECRPLDLQQLRVARLVAVADSQRPRDQVRLELAQPIVER